MSAGDAVVSVPSSVSVLRFILGGIAGVGGVSKGELESGR